MRVLAVVLALGIAASSAPSAQTPASPSQAKPPAPTPRPQGQTPAAAQQPAPTPQLAPPFQDGFKYGYIKFQVVAQLSQAGKRATADIAAMQEMKQREIGDKEKLLQDQRQKLQTQGPVMSEVARLSLQGDIERLERELSRMGEDAQKDLERLQEQLQRAFMNQLTPVIERIAKEKKLDMIFNAQDSGLVWAQPGMDLTTDVIMALDGPGAVKPAAGAGSPPPAAAVTPPPAAPPVPAAPAGK
jgi:outer membrane protein